MEWMNQIKEITSNTARFYRLREEERKTGVWIRTIQLIIVYTSASSDASVSTDRRCFLVE